MKPDIDNRIAEGSIPARFDTRVIEITPEAVIVDPPESLPADRWAVVTSAGRDLALSRLTAVGLPLPGVLVGADDVAVGKPDPEGYLKAARALGITPSRIVVVEDTPAGAQAGRAAGAFVVGICTTFPRVAGCNILIADLRGMRVTGAGPGSALRFLLRPTS